MSGYVKTFKVKNGDKDKNNKMMSFQIDDENLLKPSGLRLKTSETLTECFTSLW